MIDFLFDQVNKYFHNRKFNETYPRELSKVFPSNFKFIYYDDNDFIDIPGFSVNIIVDNINIGCIFTDDDLYYGNNGGLFIRLHGEDRRQYSIKEMLINKKLLTQEVIISLQKFVLGNI